MSGGSILWLAEIDLPCRCYPDPPSPPLLYGPVGRLVGLGFLFDEAVEKWTKDEGQDHTAAEDHHLFLEYNRDTETEKNMCYIPLSHKFGIKVKLKPCKYAVMKLYRYVVQIKMKGEF